MFVSQIPPASIQVSTQQRACDEAELLRVGEDGCTIPRRPLRLADRGFWIVTMVLAVATGWLIE